MRRLTSNSNLVTLPIVKDLKYNLKQKNALIQVVVGPRQVDKTTSVDMYLNHLKKDQYLYASADVIIQRSSEWLLEDVLYFIYSTNLIIGIFIMLNTLAIVFGLMLLI